MSKEDLNEQLRYASNNGQLELVKSLIKQGADVHAWSDWALRYASNNGYLDTVKFLVSQGADVHAGGDWALRQACLYRHTNVVNYLESLILKEKRLECLKKV